MIFLHCSTLLFYIISTFQLSYIFQEPIKYESQGSDVFSNRYHQNIVLSKRNDLSVLKWLQN